MLINASFGNYLPGSPYGWGTSGIFVLHTIPSFTAITLGSPCPPKYRVTLFRIGGVARHVRTDKDEK